MSEIDWKNLVFGYVPTDYNVRCSYADGKWGELRVHTEATMNIHISAAVLHYAQEAFEGLKAFRGKDGKVRIFRIRENAKTYAIVLRWYQDAKIADRKVRRGCN